MKIQSINPATGKVIQETESSTVEDVAAVVTKAKIAQREWAARPKEERIKVLQKFKSVLENDKGELFSLMMDEAGFPECDIDAIYYDVLEGVDYYIERYKRLLDVNFPLDTNVQTDTKAEVQFVPQGVLGHIGIWNYPFWQTMITAIPALLVGNAIVFKPSEWVTLSGLKTAELLHKAGVPEDVFSVVVGGGEIGAALTKSKVDGIVFTGGIDTGKKIIQNAGIKPLVLELSGNDPAIVCSEIDLEQAVKGIVFSSFLHSGQVCIRLKRLYVVEDLTEEFISKYVEATAKLKIGKEIYPMIRSEARDIVHEQVKKAVAEGGEVLIGGMIPEGEGFFYPPTIIKMNDAQAESFQNEIFGPVVLLHVVKNEEEAINLANDSNYGLGATVWTSNYEEGKNIAKQLETGTVWINDSNFPLVCGEYTQGWKESGISSSQERMMMFLKKRNVISHESNKAREWWF